MALANIPFTIQRGQEQTWEVRQLVASGTAASIDRGTPTKKNTTNVAIMATGDGTTSQLFTGMAKDASTETSAVAGSCNVYLPMPGVEYRGANKTAANSNTQALLDALIHKRIKFDLTGTVWTVDSAQTDATTNCIYISGGIPTTSEIQFIYQVNGSLANPTT